MKQLSDVLEKNREWAAAKKAKRPNFFKDLELQQTPKYVWIGCSDSRVPANQICGLDPGEVFVHRNVGNVVAHSDLNCQSVVQYGVDVLNIEHIIVCGHYNCGGVNAALDTAPSGRLNNWIWHIKDVVNLHKAELEKIKDLSKKQDRLCELNIITQVKNLGHTSVVQDAWSAGKNLTLHGWVYRLGDGRLQDLKITVSSNEELEAMKNYL